VTRSGRALLAGLLLTVPGLLWACAEQLPAAQRMVVQSQGLQLAFAPVAGPLPVGRHFAIDVQICPQDGTSLATDLRVDADMPAHRHGMNYKTRVRALGENRFVVDGLMFHMPGRWRFIFDVSINARNLRLTQEVQVP
jgi:hypothetical protein